MFIVLLEFSSNRDQAGRLLQAHNQWLQRGFDDGVFVLAGSLEPRQGGAIVAHGGSRAELERRVEADPFVAEKVVSARILEVTPSKANPVGETRSPRRVSPSVKEGPSAECPIGPGSTCPSPAQRGRGESGTDLGHEALELDFRLGRAS
jgi:uncharacterized protein YciI